MLSKFIYGSKKVGPRPDWSPLGIEFKSSDHHLRPFHMGVTPPPPLPRWALSRLFGIRDFAYLTVGIRDFRGKGNGDSGWNYESETGIGRQIFGKPDALKNNTSLNLEKRSKHLSFTLTISTFSHSVDCNCIQSNKSIYWRACLGLRSE